jgi:hypothetical protein
MSRNSHVARMNTVPWGAPLGSSTLSLGAFRDSREMLDEGSKSDSSKYQIASEVLYLSKSS